MNVFEIQLSHQNIHASSRQLTYYHTDHPGDACPNIPLRLLRKVSMHNNVD